MRVLVWGINYAPEVTGIGPCNTALCEYLHVHGHHVEMITTFPYYPAWRKQPGDRRIVWRTDDVNGVPVHRCWHYVPARVRWWKRMVHESTFIATSLPRVLTRPRPDLIVAVSPPLLLGPAAWLASRLLGTRVVFHVQDLQPDAAIGVGMLKPGLFTRLLFALENFSYWKAWRVSGISHGMLEAFKAKGVPVEKQFYFPNVARWGEPPPRGRFRTRHGFAAEDFLAIYSGNIGVKQGLQVLVRAATMLRERRIQVVICGDGAQRDLIAAQAEGMGNVRMLPLLPAAEYQEMLVDADLAIITQLAGSGRAFFPSKLLDPLMSSRPVLGVTDADSELTRAIQESGCGITVPPNRPEELALTLDRLAAQAELLAGCAKAGRAWVAQFEPDRVHAEFTASLIRGLSL